MKVTSHRDGTYSITGLTQSDMRTLSIALSASQVSYYRDIDSIEAGNLPKYMAPGDSLEFASEYAHGRIKEADAIARTIQAVL